MADRFISILQLFALNHLFSLVFFYRRRTVILAIAAVTVAIVSSVTLGLVFGLKNRTINSIFTPMNINNIVVFLNLFQVFPMQIMKSVVADMKLII